jgi:hypothetical protein
MRVATVRRLSIAACVSTILVMTPRVRAEGGPSELEVALRAGYGVPAGIAGTPDSSGADSRSRRLADAVSSMLMLWLDLGYRVDPRLFVGVFFQYGSLAPNLEQHPECTGQFQCDAMDIRFGFNAHVHLFPEAAFDPWLGAGVGYEIASAAQSGGPADGRVDNHVEYKGPEIANLQAGGDWRFSPHWTLGPFAAFTLGRYTGYWITNAKPPPDGPSIDGKLTGGGLHEWLMLGVRVGYRP